ncbi:hypothetical protein [Pseudonocardia broussonetiae]|uniref:Uncharacterized protein n=1 Tax=Pseudonocardia broussonetiae TaxID=2736640 RepID=A0A6M6JA72_9PSEU|nr:hypothetical protein [Pseudonocardia broussonetiae]QJY44764.1 hypothetical protein HOP40_02020 [Pseudonocardia broussonetiae]
MHAPLTGPRRWAGTAALAVLTAASWFLWTGWAVVVPGGLRFAAWQVTATVVSAVALAVLAPRWLPGRVVAVVMPLSFSAAWALTARATDDSGLWAVGAVLVLLGTVAAAAVLVPLGVALRPRSRATDRRSA